MTTCNISITYYFIHTKRHFQRDNQATNWWNKFYFSDMCASSSVASAIPEFSSKNTGLDDYTHSISFLWHKNKVHNNDPWYQKILIRTRYLSFCVKEHYLQYFKCNVYVYVPYPCTSLKINEKITRFIIFLLRLDLFRMTLWCGVLSFKQGNLIIVRHISLHRLNSLTWIYLHYTGKKEA